MCLGYLIYFEKGCYIYVVNKDGSEQLIMFEVYVVKFWICENFECE